jgi:hypothetical protein
LESFSSNNWSVGDYYEFQTSTTGFFAADNLGIIFDQTGSSTGPRDFKFQYSTDGSTFTDYPSGNYSLLNISWSSVAPVVDTTTFEFDISDIPALQNAPSVYFRLVNTSTTSISGGTVASTGTGRVDNFHLVEDFVAPPPPPPPELAIAGDLVMGLGSGVASLTVELARGPDSLDGGVKKGSPWTTTAFLRSVEFDNKGGTLHNVEGNLLAADEGTTALGGTIHSLATQGTPPLPASQPIANTKLLANGPLGQDGSGVVTLTRMSGLSVAPDNLKVAVAGMDTGKVLVYDYTAGNSMGAGASASGGRETAQILDPFIPDDPGQMGDQSQTFRYGTAWRDNNTVLSLNRDGELYSVNATTMATELEATLVVPLVGSEHTALAYNPEVAPDYIYAMYSGFNSQNDPQSRSRLFVLDADTYALVGQSDLDGLDASGDTAREIALDADGNLFIGTFGSDVFFIPDVVSTPATIDAPIHWYAGSTFSTHNGLDIGFAPPEEGDADYNGDGNINAADYVAWRKLPNQFGGDPAGYNLWRQQFGQPSPGGGGAGGVPEPAGFVMLAIGLATVCLRRRGA